MSNDLLTKKKIFFSSLSGKIFIIIIIIFLRRSCEFVGARPHVSLPPPLNMIITLLVVPNDRATTTMLSFCSAQPLGHFLI